MITITTSSGRLHIEVNNGKIIQESFQSPLLLRIEREQVEIKNDVKREKKKFSTELHRKSETSKLHTNYEFIVQQCRYLLFFFLF